MADHRTSSPGHRGFTPSRRTWILVGILAYALVIGVVALGLARFYASSRQRLETALGDRLTSVASALALACDAGQVFDFTIGDPAAFDYLEDLGRRYRQIVREGDLAEITLCDPEGTILLTTSGALSPGSPNDFWNLDRGAVDKALSGLPGATGLYRVDDVYLKSAHVPVFLEDPGFGDPLVVAVMTVSGSPDFFDALDRLKQAALLIGATVLAVLLLVGALLIRLDLALENYRASLRKQENLAAMGRMTTGIAHEIRNPLGIIRGAGQHLQQVLAGAGIEDEIAAFIPEEVDRLDRILGRYLDFGADRPGPREVFDLTAAVRKLVKNAAAELAATGVRAQMAGSPPTLPVAGDVLQFQQVLLNLLLNSRDAMPAGGLVTLELSAAGREAALRVADEGVGLPGGDPERLFEPFRTTKEKGSGLGLALSRRIVEDMGGTLELANVPGGPGAAALIRLPLSPASLPPAEDDPWQGS